MDLAPPFFPSTIASRTRVALPVAALDSTRFYSASALQPLFAPRPLPAYELECPPLAPIPTLPPISADANLPEMTSNIARLADADGKRCGWCGTSNTSQWRVGTCAVPDRVPRAYPQLPPLHACLQSTPAPLDVLCNACGLSYRRALKKIGGGLDLGALARSAAQPRQSIHKTLKRRLRLAGTHLHRSQPPAASEGDSDPLSRHFFERPRPLRLPPFNALLHDIGLQQCNSPRSPLQPWRHMLQ